MKKILSALRALFVRFESRCMKILERSKILSNLINRYGFRTVFSALCGLLMSVAYALFNVVLAIIAYSFWYSTLAVYHVIISIIRGRVVFSHMSTSYSACDDLSALKSYRNSGIILLFLNVALSSAVTQMILEDRAFQYPDWTVPTFAVYAIYKISMSIYHVLKSRRRSEVDEYTIRDINLIDSLVSILALQTALLYRFYSVGDTASVFNAVTGTLVSALSIGLSAFIVIRASKRIKTLSDKCNFS